MTERQMLGASKITDGWRIQFPADVRRLLEKRRKRPFKVGERVGFYLEADGRIVIE